jgi:hypothetical protein
MAASPLTLLDRWEQHGALWRVKTLAGNRAVVELCTCYGEPVEELVFDDPAVARYLAARSSSSDGPPA